MRIDSFGESLSFTADGATKYPSGFGTFISFIVILITLSFGYNKFMIMWQYDDTRHQVTTIYNVLDGTDEFNFEESHLNYIVRLSKDLKSIEPASLKEYIVIESFVVNLL